MLLSVFIVTYANDYFDIKQLYVLIFSGSSNLYNLIAQKYMLTP
jgi:hypothetical protein